MLKSQTSLVAVIVFVVFAGFGHLASLFALPSVYMQGAMNRISGWGLEVHEFSKPRPISFESQAIVRTSPDLAYSVCLFDLKDGPVKISGSKWDGYASLSIFNSRSNNVFVTSLDEKDDQPAGVELRLAERDTSEISETNLPIVYLRKPKGIALIRRLAPNEDSFQKATRLQQYDRCG